MRGRKPKMFDEKEFFSHYRERSRGEQYTTRTKFTEAYSQKARKFVNILKTLKQD